MKKIAFCLALASIYGTYGTAQANSLSVASPSAEFSFNCYHGCDSSSTHQPFSVTGDKTAGNLGTLVMDEKGTFTATYRGQDSGYNDGFQFTLGNSAELNEGNSLGDSISRLVTGGTVYFQFFDDHNGGHVFNDGQAPQKFLNFAILKDGLGSPYAESNAYGNFQYLLGFNDSSKSDADYDDYVVGVNYVPATVPLPAALPLMASSVGLIGVGMRRRKTQLADA